MQSYARFYNKFVVKNCKMDDKMNFSPKKLEIESKTPYICTKFRKKNMNITKSLKKIWKKGCFGYIFVVDFEILG